ncbi:MAG TPA: PDZ domain-containing protein [Phycisphaerae bacterium]|nr:PDZ domain-containing protein [Phycisphaerae bacterium]
MQLKTISSAAAMLLCLACAASSLRADADITAVANEVTKSLVAVEYTARNENNSREESGQGILIHKDSSGAVILVSGSFISENMPKEWIKDLKVRLPLKNFTSVDAKLLGRTQDRLFAFLKTEKPVEAPVFNPGDLAPSSLGEEVFAIAILGKSGGYQTYTGATRVKAILDLTHVMVNTQAFGLTRGTSPVFDLQSGKCVGITLPALGENMVLRDSSGFRRIELVDDDQGNGYLPAEEVAPLFKNIPTAPFETHRPWLGLDEITGISEDIRTVKKIDQISGVMVGAVIAGEAADKAGLAPQDIILTVDGKPFSTSPVPEIMVMHFQRALEKHKAGDTLTLGILRGDKKMDLPVTLAAAPKTSGEMPHVYSAKVGVTTRDLVFADAYARRLPQDTKGVMIALVKNGAPSSLGSTPLKVGDLVTKVNDDAVDNQQQFLAEMKKIEDAPDMKEAVFVVIHPDGNTQVCHIDLTK